MKSRLGLSAHLPVIDLIKEAVQLLWNKRVAVIRMFLPAILLLAAVDWSSQYFFPPAEAVKGHLPEIHPERALFLLVSAVLSILLATACHRFTLLPGSQWDNNALHAWRREEFQYLLRGLHIAVICLPVFFVVMLGILLIAGEAHAPLAGAAGVMVGLYIWSRLSVTLPEIALGKRSDLSRAWQLSKGNGSRLVLVVWIVPVLMASPFWLAFVGAEGIGILSYVAGFGIYLTTLVSLVMLSLSYRFLVEFSELPEDGGGQKLPKGSDNDRGGFDA